MPQSPAAPQESSETRRDELLALTVPQLVGLAFDRVITGMLDALHEAGYTDLRATHLLNVFRFLGPEGASSARLARRARITQQSMSELLGYLEERGYVTRTASPTDRRVRVVRKAERGIAADAVTGHFYADLAARWAQAAGPPDLEDLRDALLAIVSEPPSR